MRWASNGRITMDAEPAAVVVRVVGELDLANVGELQAGADEALHLPWAPPLVVDLSGCTYLDSSGLRVLARVHQSWADRQRPVMVTGASGNVRRVFELTQMDELFELH
jgi:anti-anti-sigma factor